MNCPQYLQQIISNFLKQQYTSLTLDDYSSPIFRIEQGLPKGSPLLVILYFLYNTELITSGFNLTMYTTALGYIDDVIQPTAHKNIPNFMMQIHDAGNKALSWGESHGAIFNKKKSHFMILTHRQIAKPSPFFGEDRLDPVPSTKWLRITIDSKLTFGEQISKMKAKFKAKITQL
ncbi:hypothetical protein O181_121850 [Austropuccinia psidii MF-1]|uniref:Reverse transcriptase domain-containing protein n=1 Tax=Austropuccinia psidii MF-1 TaxID=1389203 RepID=A0A9Q3KIA8_9BASI|nr:hypothetical protein [Austropuccinia psidii MF-1]